jgi:hypothetical protein
MKRIINGPSSACAPAPGPSSWLLNPVNSNPASPPPAAKLALGSACRTSAQCASGTVCQWLANATMGFCTENECNSDEECDYRDPERPYCTQLDVRMCTSVIPGISGTWADAGFRGWVCIACTHVQGKATAAFPAQALIPTHPSATCGWACFASGTAGAENLRGPRNGCKRYAFPRSWHIATES